MNDVTRTSKEQSDTPRTDAAQGAWEYMAERWVLASFAKQLEREVNQLKRHIARTAVEGGRAQTYIVQCPCCTREFRTPPLGGTGPEPAADDRKEPEWTTEAFVAGARWARMAAEEAFDDELLNGDAAYFASTGGRIRCRGDGTLQHFLRTTKPPGDVRAENERLRKLFYLHAQDVIFFSAYDQKTDTWPEIGEFWSPCVLLNDTFGYACADGERVDDAEIDRLIEAHKQWGYDGVVAWASLIRKSEPIEPRRTPKYHEARAALTKEV